MPFSPKPHGVWIQLSAAPPAWPASSRPTALHWASHSTKTGLGAPSEHQFHLLWETGCVSLMQTSLRADSVSAHRPQGSTPLSRRGHNTGRGPPPSHCPHPSTSLHYATSKPNCPSEKDHLAKNGVFLVAGRIMKFLLQRTFLFS